MSLFATLPATPLAVGSIRTYGAGLLAYGVVIVAQGPLRWSAPVYSTVVAVAPSWVWGVVIGACGALTLTGSFTHQFLLRNVGLYGGALWLALFGLATIDSARTTPRVSYALAVVYFTTSTAMCWAARAREGAPHARLT